MYLLWKLCIAFTSLSKEGLYDREFLSRTRLKAHTVVEDEAWILVREVLMVDVRFPNAIMSDINAGLQTDISVGKLSVFPKIIARTVALLSLKTTLKTELTRDDIPEPV